MSAVSLKRPPTLCTISSLFNASIISSPNVLLNAARAAVLDNLGDLVDHAVERVVHDHRVERAGTLGHMDLALGGHETLVNVVGTVAAAVAEPLQQCRLVGGQDEDHQGVG